MRYVVSAHSKGVAVFRAFKSEHVLSRANLFLEAEGDEALGIAYDAIDSAALPGDWVVAADWGDAESGFVFAVKEFEPLQSGVAE